MEKIEYSDLNKFLVSIGVTLIVVAFLLPWLYLREPFDLALTQDQISKLTKDAQTIISIRQGFILKTISYVRFASLGLFIAGLISVVIGLWRWIIKQKDLDERERIITARHKYEFKELTKAEVNQKAENEFEALKPDDIQVEKGVLQKIDKEIFVPKYLQLERSFFEMLMRYFYPQYRILSNYRLANFEYDIILESTEPNQLDFIFEIKYYPTGYRKNSFKDAIVRLAKATESYIDKTGRKAKPLLIIVLQRNDGIKLDEFSDFDVSKLREYKNITLDMMSFEELPTITKERIEKLMGRTN